MSKLPSHLSAFEGSLYDTRDGFKSPLRAIYDGGQRKIETCAKLKASLRYGSSTDLGGYPLFFITSDGAALSFEAVREQLRSVLSSIQTRSNDGWRVVAVEINYEDNDLYCAHTNAKIDSAYGDDSDSEEVDPYSHLEGGDVSDFDPIEDSNG